MALVCTWHLAKVSPFHLGRYTKNNRKGFYRYVSQKKNVKEVESLQ